MAKFYKEYEGSKYQRGKGLLIMSESAYCWTKGEPACPEPDHPTDNTVNQWAIERFETRGTEGRYAASVTMALCDLEDPSRAEREAAWSKVAYSIYIQRRMKNLSDKPTKADFEASHEAFFDLLEKLRPARVVITSLKTWNRMPACQVAPVTFWQAYRMKDDSLVWCMGVPHPAARMKDAHWSITARRIRNFRERDLPMTYTPELAEEKWE